MDNKLSEILLNKIKKYEVEISYYQKKINKQKNIVRILLLLLGASVITNVILLFK